MSVVTSRKLQELAQAKDPRLGLQIAAGDLTNEKVLGDLVLVATYIRPEKTIGGIIRPIDNIKEDEFQGKVGLVLKAGPLAFADWEEESERGQAAIPGTWVVYAIKDGWAVTVNGAPCRLVPYERIRMKISNPDLVF